MPPDAIRTGETRSWIVKAASDLDNSLEPLLRASAPLTEYAWRFRYPGEPEEPTEDEARAAIEVARTAYAAILARLPVEAHP